MRKFIFYLAMAIAASTMIGCSKEDVQTTSTGMTLTVNVDESQTSKGTISDDWKFSFVNGDNVWATNTEHMWAGSNPYGNVHYYQFVKGEKGFTSSDAKTTAKAETWYAFYPLVEFKVSEQDGTKESAATCFAYIGSQTNVPAGTKNLEITMYPQMSIIKIVNNKGSIDIKAISASKGEHIWNMIYDNASASFKVKTTNYSGICLLRASTTGTYYVAVPSGYAFNLYDGDTLLKQITADKLLAGKYYTLTIPAI